MKAETRRNTRGVRGQFLLVTDICSLCEDSVNQTLVICALVIVYITLIQKNFKIKPSKEVSLAWLVFSEFIQVTNDLPFHFSYFTNYV